MSERYTVRDLKNATDTVIKEYSRETFYWLLWVNVIALFASLQAWEALTYHMHGIGNIPVIGLLGLYPIVEFIISFARLLSFKKNRKLLNQYEDDLPLEVDKND